MSSYSLKPHLDNQIDIYSFISDGRRLEQSRESTLIFNNQKVRIEKSQYCKPIEKNGSWLLLATCPEPNVFSSDAEEVDGFSGYESFMTYSIFILFIIFILGSGSIHQSL